MACQRPARELVFDGVLVCLLVQPFLLAFMVTTPSQGNSRDHKHYLNNLYHETFLLKKEKVPAAQVGKREAISTLTIGKT